MAPRYLIVQYQRFEETDEGKKGRMRSSRCGLVSIRSGTRLEGKKWRLTSHFSLEGRSTISHRPHHYATSRSSTLPTHGRDAGLRRTLSHRSRIAPSLTSEILNTFSNALHHSGPRAIPGPHYCASRYIVFNPSQRSHHPSQRHGIRHSAI